MIDSQFLEMFSNTAGRNLQNKDGSLGFDFTPVIKFDAIEVNEETGRKSNSKIHLNETLALALEENYETDLLTPEGRDLEDDNYVLVFNEDPDGNKIGFIVTKSIIKDKELNYAYKANILKGSDPYISCTSAKIRSLFIQEEDLNEHFFQVEVKTSEAGMKYFQVLNEVENEDELVRQDIDTTAQEMEERFFPVEA